MRLSISTMQFWVSLALVSIDPIIGIGDAKPTATVQAGNWFPFFSPIIFLKFLIYRYTTSAELSTKLWKHWVTDKWEGDKWYFARFEFRRGSPSLQQFPGSYTVICFMYVGLICRPTPYGLTRHSMLHVGTLREFTLQITTMILY